MAELHVAPQGEDAIEIGTLIDDEGQRFVMMLFRSPNGDEALVTLLIPDFQQFAAGAAKLAADTATRDHWRDHPR